MEDNLVIVESPAKAKTIQGYLGKDFLVKSCFGHIRDLPKKGLAIDVNNNFKQEYIIPDDKKKIVSELKKVAKQAKTVYLASDEDREGEAISWHLVEALGLDKKATKRIVFHEITKKALSNAIASPREINENLVKAQQTRRVLDRLVGFELSPILWKKIKTGLSAGRVQSVAVRLVVEREKEINQFTENFKYKTQGLFGKSPKGKLFSAQLNKDFDEKDDISNILNKCSQASFSIEDISIKKGKKNPSAPFTTSTLQQEASKKIGLKVGTTMSVAQKLYEAGYITYMRTDSVNLSEEALDNIETAVCGKYGKEYHKRRQYKTKNAQAQEAHEAIRPTDFSTEKIPLDGLAQKLYSLIWKRTMASQMSEAQIETTTYTIGTPAIEEKFIAKGEVIIFNGFISVYDNSNQDEEEDENPKDGSTLPKLNIGDALYYDKISSRQKFGNPPPRYTESSLVKKMEEMGVGRPSTYAPTISTIQNRGYIVNESRDGKERKYIEMVLESEGSIKEEVKTEITGAVKNTLFPTDISFLVNQFLVDNFDKIIDYNFTAKLEQEFDEIANGSKNWTNTLEHFYQPFSSDVDKALQQERVSKEKLLGVCPNTGKNVYGRIAKYGPCIQLGEMDDEEKPKYVGLQKGQSLETITLEEALDLLKLPRILGQHEDKDVSANVGRFGPYVKIGSTFVSIPKHLDLYSIDLPTAIELYKEKLEKDKNKTIHNFESHGIKVLNGRFGPYITHEKTNYKIPKTTDPATLSVEDCLNLIEEGKKSPPKKTRWKKKS